ncbi:Tat pathway signal sequence domain protein [Microbacteriaceae bacterium VKM Ac-2855]|nr:Tat pathway signal sequence domain protein [Microbacteriaceae bacterium VKM Ac-2855]
MRRALLGTVATATLALGLAAAPSSATATEAAECATGPTGAVLVDAICIDPLYSVPVIDSETDVQSPTPIRKVIGHFEGTPTRFTIYLPPADQWEGRFFQRVYPIQDENAEDRVVAFGAASGGYTVQTTGTQGYRHDAAAAKFARTVAADYYGTADRQIYGYVYGGSGGSYQSIGAVENTHDVWQGAVPSILATPVSFANTASMRALAGFVLRDKKAQIEDAASAGGRIESVAGLTPLQRSIAVQATRFGVPPRAWEDFDYVDLSDDGIFVTTVQAIDPGYADAFWSEPGYLGTEKSELGDMIRAEKFDTTGTITAVSTAADGRTTVTLDGVPDAATGATTDFTVQDASGAAIVRFAGSFDPATRVFTQNADADPVVVAAAQVGATVRIDNRWHVAMYGYHRHQTPESREFTQWDQFRKADGSPIYPQRPVQVSPIIANSTTGGAAYSGAVTMKTIVVDNLYDTDAVPWGAAWYTGKVKASLGASFDDSFRVYFNDHANHQEGPVVGEKASRLVEFTDSVEQALRDVSAWAEDGVAPPASTRFSVLQNQILVPETAAQRKGIQPVVSLTAGGRDRIEVRVGEKVTFTARAQAPAGAGVVVSAEWDLRGTGEYGPSTLAAPGQSVTTTNSTTFTTPGTYYVTVQVASQRDGDAASEFANVANLDRVRVVVK